MNIHALPSVIENMTEFYLTYRSFLPGGMNRCSPVWSIFWLLSHVVSGRIVFCSFICWRSGLSTFTTSFRMFRSARELILCSAGSEDTRAVHGWTAVARPLGPFFGVATSVLKCARSWVYVYRHESVRRANTGSKYPVDRLKGSGSMVNKIWRNYVQEADEGFNREIIDYYILGGVVNACLL